jgi:two-component system phosphate regulon sensor histidine kinase PhoR
VKRHKLFWVVLPYYLGIIVISLAVAAFYASTQMRSLHFEEISRELEARARVVAEQLGPACRTGASESINDQIRRLASLTDSRITVIDSSGLVLGDSEEDPHAMENHATRAEMARALGSAVGVASRFSNTLQKNMLYVAVPVVFEGRVAAVVRVARPMTAVEAALSSFYRRLIIAGLIVAILAAVVSVFVLRRLTRPLNQLREGAERIASGDMDTRLPVPNTEEIAALAESMNSMAAQLASRIQTITQQRNEHAATLSGMSEGVIALDAADRIVSLNRSAARLLDIVPEASVGQTLFAAVRISALHDLVASSADGSKVAEAQFDISGIEKRHVLARASILRDATGMHAGAVIVLSDITRQQQLENMRRDFVANVSHELKTPITAIRGSVETLLDGAIHDQENAPRFLDMIDKQSARLSSLVDDLLSLARIEEQTVEGRAKLTRVAVSDVISAAVAACREQAAQKRISLESSCEPNIMAEMNPRQIEQALVNLISNAIQYSDEGKTVRVSGWISGNDLTLAVVDQGCGIEAKHLPRIFERFYRVDAARSRATGGTGLGLAIVKHIALAHGGRVEVVSAPGRGSTFRIHTPHCNN